MNVTIKKLHSIFIEWVFMFPLKSINIFSYYIIPLWLFITIIFLYASWWDLWHISIEFWETVIKLLVIILFFKPLAQIFPKIRFFAKLLWLRKQIWIIIFWFFIAHMLWTTIDSWIWLIIQEIYENILKSQYLWWILGGIIIFLLGITSNNYSIKLLKKNWKHLHSLVYLWFLLTALHVYFITWGIEYLLAFFVYAICKILAWKWVKF